MGRYTGPKCRMARRIGINLELKGIRLEADKCRGLEVPPGGVNRRGKLSPYGERLLEKQKVKWFYGVLDKQFMHYYAEASRSKGNTGETLLTLLERRLDNVLFKMGFAITRAQARQIVNHGHVYVNGKRCNIASYSVSAGDVITFSRKEKFEKFLRLRIEESKGRIAPGWLEADKDKLEGRVVSLPTREDVSLPVNEQLIIELLSR